MITAGFIQFAPVFGEKERNLETIRALIEKASGADLLVLPELGATGYNFTDAAEVAAVAETLGEGPTSETLLGLARKHNAVIIMGYAEKAGNTFYNSSMLCTPNGELHNYRKLHLFFREKIYFTPGDALPAVVETTAGRIGMMICYDWLFPEVARTLMLAGAQILAHPSNLVLDKCQRAMFARCVENRVFGITANRTGTEDRAEGRLDFTGGSQILDPRGQEIVKAPPTDDYIGLGRIDLKMADDKKVTELNCLLEDRRPEFYTTVSRLPAGRAE